MSFLDINLELMPPVRQFILYQLEKKKNGTTKIPISPISGNRVDVNDQRHWVTAQDALAAAPSFKCDGIGFVIGSGYWLLDIDHCVVNEARCLLAAKLNTEFNGAYVEISCSGEGLHIIGRGQAPEHACRADGIEFYTEKRFVALTGTNAQGSMDFNAEHLLSELVNTYFAKSLPAIKPNSATSIDCPISDEELIQLMLDSKTNPFRQGASFRDLWDGNEAMLAMAYPLAGERQDGLAYDASRADAALAQHLAFWTGNDAECMTRLMYQSALVREKWQRADYIPRTIESARAKQTTFYQGSTTAQSQKNEIKLNLDVFAEVSITDIFTNPPSPPDFIIESILPRGVLTLLGGHGGCGKSLLALRAAICVATGCSFMGKQVKQGRVIFYSAEDATDIVRYRLSRLCRHMKIDPILLSNSLKILDATNNPVLYHEINNSGVKQSSTTPSYERLSSYVNQFSPDVIIIDNASDTFDANENERRHVRGFIRQLVQLGKSQNAAVLLIAHVDKQTARNSGSSEGYSGSTAWHNSARSRLFLTMQEGILVLEHKKSNWGMCAEPIHLQWTLDGLLEQIIARSQQEDHSIVLSLIQEYYKSGSNLAPAPTSIYNIFKKLSVNPQYPKFLTREKLAFLLEEMIRNKELHIEEYKNNPKSGNINQRYAPTTPT